MTFRGVGGGDDAEVGEADGSVGIDEDIGCFDISGVEGGQNRYKWR